MGKKILRLFQAALLCVLAACGGGGGGAESTNPSNNSISLSTSSISMDILGPSGVDTPLEAKSHTVSATFRGAGVVVGIPPGAPALPTWLSVSTQSVTGNTAHFSIGYQRDAPVGRHALTLRFVTGNADGSSLVYRDLALDVNVRPEIQFQTVMSFTTTVGALPTQQWFTLPLFWNAGALNLRASAPWIRLDRTIASSRERVLLTVDPTGMSPGEHTGNITITQVGTVESQVLPVQLVVEAPRLVVRQRGVSLSLQGAQANLTASAPVTDNVNASQPWQAHADQAWLQLTPASGAGAGAIALRADATGLADGMHVATVTVSSPAAGVAGTSFRVGLYVNRGTAPQTRASTATRSLAATPATPRLGLAADPIRPYLYHSRGDGRVDIYNAYNANLESFITVPTGIGSMATAPDGSRLYLQHAESGALYVIDLDTRSLQGPLGTARVASELAYTEVNGRPVLVTNALQVLDPSTGAVLADADSPDNPYDQGHDLAVRRDGRAVYFQSRFVWNYVFRYTLSHHNGVVALRLTHRIQEPGRPSGITLDWNDNRVFTAWGTSGSRYDPDSMEAQYVFNSWHRSDNSRGLEASPDGTFFLGVGETVQQYLSDASTGRANISSSAGPVTHFFLFGNGTRLVTRETFAGQETLTFTTVP